jgi:hypothetical protein
MIMMRIGLVGSVFAFVRALLLTGVMKRVVCGGGVQAAHLSLSLVDDEDGESSSDVTLFVMCLPFTHHW